MKNEKIFVEMCLQVWQTQVKSLNQLLAKLSDEQLMNEIVPTKNRGVYILGHLISGVDLMFPLIFTKDVIYPELPQIFIKTPDKKDENIPTIKDLKQRWEIISEKFSSYLIATSAEEWFTKHNNISVEVFAIEPNRNKLNVLISRTTHLSYHLGQLNLLAK